MKKERREIFSVFGQIDAVVAEAMIAEGKAARIDCEFIPESVSLDERGRRAQFAVAIDRSKVGEFNSRVRDLYA